MPFSKKKIADELCKDVKEEDDVVKVYFRELVFLYSLIDISDHTDHVLVKHSKIRFSQPSFTDSPERLSYIDIIPSPFDQATHVPYLSGVINYWDAKLKNVKQLKSQMIYSVAVVKEMVDEMDVKKTKDIWKSYTARIKDCEYSLDFIATKVAYMF